MSPLDRLYVLLIVFLPIVHPANVLILGHLVQVSDLIALITMLAWIVTVGLGQRTIRHSRFYVPLALYFGALCLSVFVSESPRQSIVKLVGAAYLVGLSLLTINVVRSWTIFRSVMTGWMVGTAVTVVSALVGIVLFYLGIRDPVVNVALSSYGTLPPGDYPRINSLFANANMMCNYLIISLVFVLTMARLGWLTSVSAGLLLSGTWVAALSTLSLGLGGLFLSGGAWARLHNPFGRAHARARWLFAGGVVASLLFLGATLVSPTSTEVSPSERTLIWRTAVATFVEHPLLGIGAGMEILSIEEQTPTGVLRYSKDPHNVWLSIAVQTGLAGLSAFVFLVIHLWRRTIPLRAEPSRVSIVKSGLRIAFIGTLLYHGLSGSFEDARHLWVLMGLIVCVDEELS